MVSPPSPGILARRRVGGRTRSTAVLALLAAACAGKGADAGPAWTQWGGNAQHSGTLAVTGQALGTIHLDYVYDPFVAAELVGGSGSLPVHYMTPLTEGDAVYMETKSGAYSADSYATQVWGIVRFARKGDAVVPQWKADSDWKAVGGSADFWEPVFHGAIANGYLYVPGARGTLLKLDETSGSVVARIVPDSAWDAQTYTVSPVTADAIGNLYFTVLRASGQGPAVARPAGEVAGANGHAGTAWGAPMPSAFYGSDAVDSFLVKVGPHDSTRVVSIATLVPDAPKPGDACYTAFADADLPWPPSAAAVPPMAACGTQRVAVNAAPAVAPDGTVYIATRSHFNSRYAYLVAVHPDLTPKWDTSLRDRLDDGCGVPRSLGGQLEPNGAPGGCASGASYGVDPATNRQGGGRILDDASSSPAVAPDGSVFFGAFTSYNYSEGHLMHFSAKGAYLGAYPFGWDTTPAIYVHDGTYSLVTKDNHYGQMGSYCSSEAYCPSDRNASAPDSPEEYFVTQLSPTLKVEWQYKANNHQGCTRGATGSIACVADHPNSFEWCVNAPAIDASGTVFVNSEDGWLYAIAQGGKVKDKLFQQRVTAAAYTPASLGPDGKVYSQNSGHLLVIGR